MRSTVRARSIFSSVRKHRAPKGALRLIVHVERVVAGADVSESTERQKVHLDTRPLSVRATKLMRSESTEHQKVH